MTDRPPLVSTTDGTMDAMQRLRRRLAVLLDDRTPGGRLRQKTLARYLNKSEAWLSNILAGRKGLRLVDLDQLAEFFALPPAELIRRESDNLVEVTPTELALLRKFRRMDEAMRNAILKIAGLEPYMSGLTANHPPPAPKKRGRPPKKPQDGETP